MAERFKACSVDGCNGNAHWAAGGKKTWCNTHYMRWRRHGDTSVTRKTPNGEAYQWLLEASTLETDECINWPFSGTPSGYGTFFKDGVSCYAHRYVCEQANGAPSSPHHEAAHWCGNASCVNQKHIRWATPTENQADRLTHGTDGRGEKCPTAKLKEHEVRKIRDLEGSLHPNEIAAMFGISRRNVEMIHQRKSWDHLQ